MHKSLMESSGRQCGGTDYSKHGQCENLYPHAFKWHKQVFLISKSRITASTTKMSIKDGQFHCDLSTHAIKSIVILADPGGLQRLLLPVWEVGSSPNCAVTHDA